MDSNTSWCFFGDTYGFVDAVTLEATTFSSGDEVVMYIGGSDSAVPSYQKYCVLPKDISWTDLICAIIKNHLY